MVSVADSADAPMKKYGLGRALGVPRLGPKSWPLLTLKFEFNNLPFSNLTTSLPLRGTAGVKFTRRLGILDGGRGAL